MEIKDVLFKIGYSDLRDFGKEWRTRPLYRTSGNGSSLAIKKATGEWYDFSSRQGGGLAQLVQLTLNLKSEEVESFIGGEIQYASTPKDKYELSGIQKFNKQMLFRLRKDHTYWVGRKVSQKTVEQFQGGTTFNGRMAYRYVFPIFDDKDNLIGFSGRSLTDNPDFPKWKHIGSKSNWCYPLKWNSHVIMETKEVILLESIGDMLALWERGIRNTLVTFGVEISPKIIEFLLKMDIHRILLAFNNDSDNEFVGNKAATDGKKKLEQFFDPHQVVIAVPDQKDFGVMTSEEILLWQKTYQQQKY